MPPHVPLQWTVQRQWEMRLVPLNAAKTRKSLHVAFFSALLCSPLQEVPDGKVNL